MRLPACLLALLLTCAAALAQTDLVNVRDCGAVGDGVADDTAAFQAAISRGKEAGQHVYVPRGRYVLSDTLTLDGMGLTGPVVGAWPADIDALPSLLVPRSGHPAFHLLAGSSVQGVDITCQGPEPAEGEGAAAILISGIGCYVHNVRIRYPWDGIITDGENNVGRLNVENVFMVSPLNVGVRVTGTWDVPALRNVEVWNAGPVPRGLDKGIGFLLGKNDLIRVTDCFAFAMRYGFMLADKIEGCKIEGGTWGLLTGCSTDYCGTGVAVRGENTVSITGGTFWEHADSLLVEGEGARVRVCGAELKSNGQPAIIVRGGDHVVITGCSILRNMEGFSPPAVMHEAGQLVLSDNMIDSRGVGVRIGPDVAGCVVRGNMIRTGGAEAVVNGAPAERVSVEGNLTGD
jgi:hypothetical protein